MRTPLEPQATVTAQTVKIQDDRLVLQAEVRLELPMPARDADLPGRLEAGIERGGQMLRRRLFQHAVEQVDAELVLGEAIAWPVARGGDKGYRAGRIDDPLLEIGIKPVIPSKENEDRAARPVEFD